mmetsp:Transcript_26438/g.69492  ORF Transcript_26438/g.69492 Transcript_26438/m.69492 type:complete len:259 (-) Transcript_26438:723-1499(-)
MLSTWNPELTSCCCASKRDDRDRGKPYLRSDSIENLEQVNVENTCPLPQSQSFLSCQDRYSGRQVLRCPGISHWHFEPNFWKTSARRHFHSLCTGHQRADSAPTAPFAGPMHDHLLRYLHPVRCQKTPAKISEDWRVADSSKKILWRAKSEQAPHHRQAPQTCYSHTSARRERLDVHFEHYCEEAQSLCHWSSSRCDGAPTPTNPAERDHHSSTPLTYLRVSDSRRYSRPDPCHSRLLCSVGNALPHQIVLCRCRPLA